MESEPRLRIAIVGGGLVGSAAYLALSKLDNSEITVFERAPALREAGAWISLTPTGLFVLNRLVERSAIRNIVYRPPDRAVYAHRHWRTGEILINIYSSPSYSIDYVQARTHRLPLLQSLAASIPSKHIKYGRNVIDVDIGSQSASLVFDDGVKRDFDLIVAADGLYSRIRQKFHPSHKVQSRGFVAYRKNFPERLVEHISQLPDDTSAWCGVKGDVVFLSRLGLDVYGVVIFREEEPEYIATLQWQRAIGPKGLSRLRKLYQNWDPLIGKVLDVIDDIDAYPLQSGPWLRNLTKHNRVAFVGDAAHLSSSDFKPKPATAGAYGAGASMGFGDIWALYRSLAVSQTSKTSLTSVDGVETPRGYDLPRALRLFNETRRYFLQRVEKQMSIDVLNDQYIDAAGDDESEWIRWFKERHSLLHWITEHDVEVEFQNKLAEEVLWPNLDSNELKSAESANEARL